jgi:uncharacterized protein (DUF2252 family)
MAVVEETAAETATIPKVVTHLSVDESKAKGKLARDQAPRDSHADFEARPDRPDPVALLESQAGSRVPELVPIRYGRMLVSPFTFFRGAALIMASDLSETPRSGINAQICGDAHLSNFGIFGSPERELVFDCNDFDETLPGPWEWDVKRLAASIVVAGRLKGFSKSIRNESILALGLAYRQSMRQMAAQTNLEVWYSHIEVESALALLKEEAVRTKGKDAEHMAATVDKVVAKARTKDSTRALEKLTTVVDGQRCIVSQPPLIVPLEELFPGLESEYMTTRFHEMLRKYRATLPTDRKHLLEQFQIAQIARKVVGVGSVGTRCWILLLVGQRPEDVLFLQAKEAEASVLERFTKKSAYNNHGSRVVAGQRLMQASSDIFLGWQRTDGIDGISRDYYVRQLQDWKGSVDVEDTLPVGMSAYGATCANALARAHARSGDRIAIASYLGNNPSFEKALVRFAERYADQNEKDYEAFAQACRSGRLHAEEGV